MNELEEQASYSTTGTVYCFDPITDFRWESLVSQHPRASLFHSTAWLRALQRTYGYRAVAYTTCPPKSPLNNAVLFMEVNSWLTGKRLVSLPFSDHCDFLADDPHTIQRIFDSIEKEARIANWRYMETRPVHPIAINTELGRSTEMYYFHEVDLRPDITTIFRRLHKNSIQRKILRAERESLVYDEGRSPQFLNAFHKMLVVTRKRHRVPAQPKQWFENLIDCFGDKLKIRLAHKDGQPIAGMLTLQHRDTLTYKYGCSDVRFNKTGSMHLLYWRSIVDAKTAGLRAFDLGRTDADQPGLITFKSRWGATESTLNYCRYVPSGARPGVLDPIGRSKVNFAKRVFSHAPKTLLSMIGSRLYKHIG